MANSTERPGVLIYHEWRRAISKLNYEEKGMLFEAILDYSDEGKEPSFSGMVEIVWDLIMPQIDRSTKNYEKRGVSGKYAVYCREEKKAGREPLKYPDYCALHDEREISNDEREISNDIKYINNINKTNHNSIIKEEGAGALDSEGAYQQLFQQGLTFEDMRAEKIRQLEGMK